MSVSPENVNAANAVPHWLHRASLTSPAIRICGPSREADRQHAGFGVRNGWRADIAILHAVRQPSSMKRLFACMMGACLAIFGIAGCTPSVRVTAPTKADKADWITPENDFEKALLHATENPQDRVRFESEILDEYVFIRVSPESTAKINNASGPDGKLTKPITVTVWFFEEPGRLRTLPIFTSPNRLESVYPEAPWARIKFRHALSIAEENSVELNHGLAPRIILSPSQVSEMLAASKGTIATARVAP